MELIGKYLFPVRYTDLKFGQFLLSVSFTVKNNLLKLTYTFNLSNLTYALYYWKLLSIIIMSAYTYNKKGYYQILIHEYGC